MNIIFICGSINEGFDGVGDYTRRLGFELKKLGHKVSIISLFEKGLKSLIIENQVCESYSIEVLRIPSALTNDLRFFSVESWITNKKPDWISLQFVIFSFHPKGLPFEIIKQFKKLQNLSKWHLMFHELWVGIEDSSTFKEVIWGKLQKRIILKLIQTLRPKAVHTHAGVYKYQLEKSGVKARLLPLFSNIPLINPSEKLDSIKNKEKIRFVIFGAIHPKAPIEIFSSELKEFASKNNRLISILFIGRNGSESQFWKSCFQQHEFECHEYGEKCVEKISDVLLRSDIGISSTPFKLIEKSGAVAAMADHGLEVICVARAWEVKEFVLENTSDGIHEYKPGYLPKILTRFKARKFHNFLQSTTDQFINELSL